MKTIIEEELSPHHFKAIVNASTWFEGFKPSPARRYLKNPFKVVVTYTKWNDTGAASSIEAKTTIAICLKLKHAKLIFNSIKK